MAIDFTPLVRPFFIRKAQRTDAWAGATASLQHDMLRNLLRRASATEVGKRFRFTEISGAKDAYEVFRREVPVVGFEAIRHDVMRMIRGERDVLWPGVCRNFAQSSGTSGGKSKYIPVTDDSLRLNHYRGAADSVAHYLRSHPGSRMFSGKGFILGGSFANELNISDSRVRVGDLSATLIRKITPLADMVRVPARRIALMSDWERKLPLLARAAMRQRVTNISGVPSWFLVVLRKILEYSGAETLNEVWPDLEVFFHGGIAFTPYRGEYDRIIDPARMHYVETYNASEGFFASQNDPADPAMLLGIDTGIFYEFAPAASGTLSGEDLIPAEGVETGKVYELVITAPNGLWRYRLGDTVRIESVDPIKIVIAGRTKCFINAFGEELMEANAERAIADVCEAHGAAISNYTAAPVYASDGHRGRHQWLIEWDTAPADTAAFAADLDKRLRELNSDYDAKRKGDIFLDPLSIVTARRNLFTDWLRQAGNHKLGGQRKVPRLSNDRTLIDRLLRLNAGE